MQSLPSEDGISEGAAYACACGLNCLGFFFFELILLSCYRSVLPLLCLFVCLFRKGLFFPSTYNEGEQTNR